MEFIMPIYNNPNCTPSAQNYFPYFPDHNTVGGVTKLIYITVPVSEPSYPHHTTLSAEEADMNKPSLWIR